MSSFPFSFLSGSRDKYLVSRPDDRPVVYLPKCKPTVSRQDDIPVKLCLRVSNVIKKELGGKKKCTVKRLTPKQYKDLKILSSLRKIGPVKRLTSEENQTLKRTSEFALFDIITRPNRCTCGNNVCTC